MKRLHPKHPVAARLAVVADPIRLRMLRLLEQEELSVGEVASVVQMPQSTVSRHLKALAELDWLLKRQEGTASLYRLIMDDLPAELLSIWKPVRELVLAETSEAEFESDARRLKAVLAARRTDSRTFFGRVADEWHHVRTSLFGEGFTAPALLGLLDPRWTVADLGCGSGDATRYLAPVVERVIAIDQSEAMLEAGRRQLREHSNIEFRCGDLETLPCEDASVDAAVVSLVLHHVEEPAAVLAECRRILRTDLGGGVLLVVDMLAHDRDEYRRTMGHHHLGFSADQMTQMLHEAGFDQIAARELPTGAKTMGPGLLAASARLSPTG